MAILFRRRFLFLLVFGLLAIIASRHMTLVYDAAAIVASFFSWLNWSFWTVHVDTPVIVLLLPTVIALAVVIALFSCGRNPPRLMRSFAMLALFIFHTVYISYRAFGTLSFDTAAEAVVSSILFLVELVSYFCLSTLYLQLAWPTDRISESMQTARDVRSGAYAPGVDVFITTYNEPLEMVRRTAIGCQGLAYPGKRVYILDDRNRPEMKALALQLGCEYIARERNTHAKAGNLNNALARTGSELVAVFDADCIPVKSFLARTVGFFCKPATGMVIVSQHFYNAETALDNMSVETVMSSDQSTFFSEAQCGRDTFNAMLCFGTGFVARRSALERIGGIPTETLSEDWATTIKLQAAGYQTYSINERLTAGMAAESIGEFVQQRLRWTQGTLQSLFSSTNPFRVKGLRFTQRAIHSYSILYYLMFPLHFIALLCPLAYFFFGVIPIKTTLQQMIFYFLPFFVLLQVTFSWVCNNYSNFLSSHVYEFFLYFPVTRAVAGMIKNPFNKAFRVTRKGIRRPSVSFHRQIALPLIIVLVLYAVATVYGLLDSRWRGGYDICLVMTAWTVFRMIVLWVSLQAAIDMPQERNAVRFPVRLACEIFRDGSVTRAMLDDLSERGAFVAFEGQEESVLSGRFTLQVPEIGVNGLSASVTRAVNGKGFGVEFSDISLENRRRLVECLYCNRERWENKSLSPAKAAMVMLASAFKIYPVEKERCSYVAPK